MYMLMSLLIFGHGMWYADIKFLFVAVLFGILDLFYKYIQRKYPEDAVTKITIRDDKPDSQN